MLKTHALRVGIAKGPHLNVSQGCGDVMTIAELFGFAAVEGAHREVEDCRDRILQETIMRKMQRKLDEGGQAVVEQRMGAGRGVGGQCL